uniref:aECM cysteine-cradle domain-containing protein n=1 Tax=Meloidogyne hapla TaxID=6305 RepID=A0A1I8BVQ3_MELHA
MNTFNSRKSNILKIPKLSKLPAPQRLIRQIENEENDGIKKENPKRYKCFLIEDEEEEQIVEEGQQQNKKQYLSELAKTALVQRSYFAGFLKDGNENNIMGWEDVGRSDNPRRSEGTNSQYLLEKEQNQQNQQTKTPIIEYIDDYETSPHNENRNTDINTPDSPQVSSGSSYNKNSQSSSGWETIPAVQARFSTKDSHPTKEKETAINKNSVESSASFEVKQRKQQIDEDASDDEKVEEEDGDESEEDLYSDEDNNAITSTTTAKSTIPKIQKVPQRNAANGGSPRARVFPGLSKLITQTNSLVTTNKPIIQQAKQKIVNTKDQNTIAKEYANKENNIGLDRNTVDESVSTLNGVNYNENGLLNQNFINHQSKNIGQQQLKEVKMPPHDSQGRPLLLSPEHCKMVLIASYAQLYGASPSSVLSFVRNNCAFVKMYLPTASCSEIETLVKSCYERKVIMRKQLLKRRFL